MANKIIDLFNSTPPNIKIEEKPMKFRCAECGKPLYEDRDKHPTWIGCQCEIPVEPAPEPPPQPVIDWDCYC